MANPSTQRSSAQPAVLQSMLQSTARGAIFFSLFLPSFSNIGYQLRRPFFKPTAFRFSGQHWLVTGASEGLGREIARRAALGGATVIAVARNQERLDSLASEVAGEAAEQPAGGAAGRILPLAVDLSRVGAVNGALAPQALPLPAGVALDVLVNNVGVMLDTPAVTAEGLDLALATNLIVPYALTEALAADGRLGADAVVINMSSGGMYNVPLSLRALLPGRRYNGTLAYAFHKRAQVVLNRYWQDSAEHAFRSYVMHPGWVETPGVQSSMPDFYRTMKPILREVAAGADTALWLAATRPDGVPTGGIWLDRKRRPEHLLPGTRGGASAAELLEFLRQQLDSAQQVAALPS